MVPDPWTCPRCGRKWRPNPRAPRGVSCPDCGLAVNPLDRPEDWREREVG